MSKLHVNSNIKGLIILGMILLLPSIAFAWCTDCGTSGCCPCPGEAQCLGSASSCEEACGLASSSAPVSSPAPAVAVGPTPEQQLGSQIGQLGAQMILQAMQGPTPQQIAARDEQQRELAAQQALEAQQKQEAQDRRNQEIHDHLVTEMKSEDGTSGSGEEPTQQQNLPLMKDDDSSSGPEAIKGLPGIALNDNSGNGSSAPYGIPGLPGTHVNGPGAGSGIVQSDEGNLPLMKDDDESNSHSSNSSGR